MFDYKDELHNHIYDELDDCIFWNPQSNKTEISEYSINKMIIDEERRKKRLSMDDVERNIDDVYNNMDSIYIPIEIDEEKLYKKYLKKKSSIRKEVVFDLCVKFSGKGYEYEKGDNLYDFINSKVSFICREGRYLLCLGKDELIDYVRMYQSQRSKRQ